MVLEAVIVRRLQRSSPADGINGQYMLRLCGETEGPCIWLAKIFHLRVEGAISTSVEIALALRVHEAWV